MKAILFILTALGITISIFAQQNKNVRLYGYSQIVIPGVAPRDIIMEGGQQIPVERKQRKNTWIYLTFPTNVPLKQCELFINGKKYNIEAQYLTKTPVTYTDHNIPDFPKTIEMVPATAGKVLQLIPTKEMSFKPNSRLSKLMKENEVVVSYMLQGKKYYTTINKLTSIEPAVAS